MSDFMNRQTIRAALMEHLNRIGHPKFLRFNKDEEFLAETAYLQYWDRETNHVPSQEGVEVDVDYFDSDGQPFVQLVIYCDQLGEAIRLLYANDPKHPGRHDLTILHEESVVYQRSACQDPRTEWGINCMAGDDTVTDAHGKMLFAGDHTNI